MLEEMVIDGIEILGGGEAADPADDALLRAAQGDQRAFAELILGYQIIRRNQHANI